ncbi:MAG: methyl-accepting chemotaxis protein [Desulfobacterales bacterium]|nr:methyl-accepting chemotaxis protein [Desulfobacterales bacterium]MDD4071624.1 methyl-accepting chemotaxis protein [Desulfobacterales bacterium]MDD4391624.1 methyl-accepting chemotaxis protein [Desulfobacterales bacterium]
MRQIKLGTKLLTGGLLVLVIPVIIIGVVSVYESSRSISGMGKADMANIAESLAAALDIGMNEQIVTVRNISYSSSVITAAEKVMAAGEKSSQDEVLLAQKELTKIKTAEGDRISSLVLTGRNGIVYASSDNGKFNEVDLAGRDYLDKAFKGTPNIGSVVISRATGRVVCTAACPIYDSKGKEITGSVVMIMELKFFSDILDRIRIGKTGYAYIVDQKGLFIHCPVKENILKVNVSEIKGMENITQMIGNAQSGITEYELDGMKTAAIAPPLSATGWRIVTAIPTEELYAPARFTRNAIILIGMISIVIASLIFFFFARSITRPLIHIVGAAGKIAGGDLSVEITSKNRQDEIGDLARAFTGMIQSLKDKTRVAQKIAGGDLTVEATPLSGADALGNAFLTMVVKLREQIMEIVEGVNVLASSGSEIMASVSQLTSGAAETATAVSETTTTVEEVKQTALVSTQKAKHVSELGRKTVEISQTGLKAIDDTIQGMNHIKEQVESIADMVVRLSEQSQAIGEIIATVNDLAEQSNLLAVNASIEAAKAGEQGKGFAVVAQEIRSLAAQSKQATTQVRNILFDVQKAISSAVMATELGGKAVEAGVSLSRQAGEAIDFLAESVTEASDASIQIAASSQQQLIGMDQVVSAMENIREAALQTSASTKQTEQSAHDLNNLGLRLQDIVKFYKV